MCEVVPGLFVGNLQDAAAWPGPRLCVLENWPGYWPDYPCRPGDAHIPIFNGAEASVAALDACAAWLEERLAAGEKVLLHCGAGMERSPLTAAWFLYRRRGLTWEQAYAVVQAARPLTQRRDAWVPAEARGLAPKGAEA